MLARDAQPGVECMEEGPVAERPAWRRVGSPFVTKYSSECKTCARMITEGVTSVQRWDFGDERTCSPPEA